MDGQTFAARSWRGHPNRRHVAPDQRRRSIADGLAAEDAFADLLDRLGVLYRRPAKLTYAPDRGDFIIRGRVWDVKSTTMPGRAVVCAAQAPHPVAWYVHFRLGNGEPECLGCIRWQDMLRYSARVPRGAVIPGPGVFRASYRLYCLTDLTRLRPVEGVLRGAVPDDRSLCDA